MNRVQRILLSTTIAVSAALFSASVTAPVQAQVSQQVGKALADAQSLARAGRTPEAAAKAQQALGAASTAEERSKAQQMLLFVYSSGRRWGDAAKIADSLGRPAKERFGFHYNAGNLPKALELANALPNDYSVQSQVPQIYLRQGKMADAKKAYTDLIAKNGERKELLQGLASTQFKLGEKQNYIATLSKLIRLDPSSDNWRRLLNDLKNQQMPDVARLSLYDLMNKTGNLTAVEDVEDMAKIAIVTGAPGWAQRILKEKAPTSGLNNTANLRAGQTAKGIAAQEKAAASGPDLLRVGRGYLGMGNYAKAISLFQKATGRADPGEINLMVGLAMMEANNVAGARKAFTAVPANSAYRDIAQLWNLFASMRA